MPQQGKQIFELFVSPKGHFDLMFWKENSIRFQIACWYFVWKINLFAFDLFVCKYVHMV